MAVQQPQFSPKQVADALQVSESSVKRWCDAGSMSVLKTLGGHRRISLDSLQQFLRDGNRSLVNPQVLGLPTLSPARVTPIPGGEDPIQKEFREALAAGNEEVCRQAIMRRLDQGWTRTETAEYLITDAMYGIGQSWSDHELDVYQERRSCEICLRIVQQLRAQLAEPAEGAPIAIGGAPEGDPYQLPSVLVELTLREVGWHAVNLGNNLPLESFLQAAHDYQPKLVWLSVSSIADPAMFIAAENKLAASLDDDVSLLVGGRALSDSIRPRLRYTAHCDSMRHLSELASMMRLNLTR